MKNKNGNPNDSTKTSVQGVRKHARNGKYVVTYTKYLGAFDTLQQAKEAREKFIAKVSPERTEKAKSARKEKAKTKAKSAAKPKLVKSAKPKAEHYEPVEATA